MNTLTRTYLDCDPLDEAKNAAIVEELLRDPEWAAIVDEVDALFAAGLLDDSVL